MNSYPAFVDFFIDVPEEADTLMAALRSQVIFPCLCVEFYDEDPDQSGSQFRVLKAAFVVLAHAEKKEKGQDHTRSVIYEVAKPAADQIFAHMLKKSDKMELKVNGKPAIVIPSTTGNWVGPVHNDLYGWRIEFTWRIASGTCYKPELWV
jgi:hypothetical protein